MTRSPTQSEERPATENEPRRTVVEATGLSLTFETADGPVHALSEVDLRVGGKYRIQMKHTDGSIHTAVGEYREISEPEKLVYTWSWEDGSMSGSLVTVKFRDLGSATELLLTHERFPTAELRDKHGQGWNGCLGRLEEHLAE